MTLAESVKFFGTAVVALLVAAPMRATGKRFVERQRASTSRGPHTRVAERERPENGHAQRDTWTRVDVGSFL